MAASAIPRPVARPRVYPVGRAVLLMGVCAEHLAGRRFTVDGRRVQTVRYGSIALVVAFVNQAAYDPDEIARKRIDPAWLGAEARALERTIDRLGSGGDVLPMRLLTVFPHADALEAAAAERHARWARALARLGTKREWAVHVYAGPHVPPGAGAYVARVSGKATRATRVPAFTGDPETVAVLANLWRDLGGIAIAMRRVASVPERGGRFVQALLVSEPDVAALGALVDRFNHTAAGAGLIAYLEGPRRPFSFVV
ncbi:MAG: hypothetical protein NVS3B17_15280 [Vulcanimicrobiaceae bacterium]